MWRYFAIVFCFFLFVAGASALTFDENIKLCGGGSLISETNSKGAKDAVHGTGYQNYTRNISKEEKSVSLSSDYKLDKSPVNVFTYNRSFKTKTYSEKKKKLTWEDYSVDFGSNSYAILMKIPANLQHGISVYSAKSIDVNNAVSFKDGKMKTNYSIAGSGELSETIVDFNVETKPDYIAKTKIKDTDFSLTSGLSDRIILGSEIDKLIDWARTSSEGPKSINSNKKVDPEKGIVGKPAPGVTTEYSEEPRSGEDNVNEGKTATSGNQTVNKSEERYGIKSAPNMNKGTENSADREEKTFTRPRTASVILVESKNHYVPTAFIGKVSQFEYTNKLWDTESKNTTKNDYNESYERGMRIVEMRECNGTTDGLCQNYTYISAAYRFGEPKPWTSPYAQLDKVIMPPSL